MTRLVTIVRQDITPGYQIAQSIHSAVELILDDARPAWDWHLNSNYVLVLGVDNEDALNHFNHKLHKINVASVKFYEPDVNQYTSLSFFSTEETDKLTAQLPLAGNMAGNIDKDHKE